MLATSLNTNEIKNSAGTEVEFQHRQYGEGMMREFSAIGELPNLEHRLVVSHQESGSAAKKVRRSLVRFNKNVAGVDGTIETISFYTVAVIPVGNLANFTEVTNVCAELVSFLASLGASTTILYDGTGNGATSLINGSL